MSHGGPVQVDISVSTDVAEARRCVQSVAVETGFNEVQVGQLAIVVSELGSNIVKYAGAGMIRIREVSDEYRRGIEVEAHDRGPGLGTVEDTLVDGYSTSGTLGAGLGAVDRLMDELVIASSPEGGTHVTSRMWLRRIGHTQTTMQLSFGAATRPHPRMAGVNGDAFVICRRDEFSLVGVIDGVGHGQFAQRAAQTARREVEARVTRPLDDIFRSVGRACRATRGVGMALARFDCSRSTVELASVGNIELRTRGDAVPVRYLVRRGILGLNAPGAAVTEQSWNQEAMMVMYSDGIRSHWGWEESPEIDSLPATEVAGTLLRKYAREDDDATVLVVKGLR